MPWPIIQADIGTGKIDNDIEHLPGAGVLAFYWQAGRVVGQQVFDPARSPPTQRDILDAGRAFSILDAGRQQRQAPSTRSVSVVIPTRNRPDDLRRCLESVRGQTRRPDEIIVVDNTESDLATAELVGSFPEVTYLREPRPGASRARNAGIRAAQGEIVAFCDDDVRLHASWTERMVAAFDAPVDAVTGLVLPAELATSSQRIFEFTYPFGKGFSERDFGPEFMRAHSRFGCPTWKIGAGASMAFRRSVFPRIGLFDARLDAGAAGCSGDGELWYRLLAAGGTCRYDPSIISFHTHRRTMPELRAQMRAYMRGNIVSLLIQNRRYGHRGNLLRAFLKTPYHLLRRGLRILLVSRRPEDATYLDEVRGYCEGLGYYLRHAGDPDEIAFGSRAAMESVNAAQ